MSSADKQIIWMGFIDVFCQKNTWIRYCLKIAIKFKVCHDRNIEETFQFKCTRFGQNCE